jgi:hypothetical protein
MAITSAPHRGGRTARHGQLALIAAVTAAFILAMLAVVLLVHGGGSSGPGVQGSGIAATQTRTVAGFSRLDLAGSNNVTVAVGAPQSVVVHADSNLISHVTTQVAGGTLVIGDTGSFTARSPMSVEVSVPSLTALNLSGAGQISVTGINVPQLTVTVSGSGLLSAAGTASRLDVTLSGDGQAQLFQLTARDVQAVVTGSGLIQVTATTSLDASVPGTGAIVYRGDPPQVTTSVTGTGAVTPG